MNTREAVAARILELCKKPGTVTIKKLCDEFKITLGDFFSTLEFDALDQEIC